ncbi:hypothetical protein F5888DRAFT_1913620 [Russula emetica]|nr:hypothetical protein F5888DRAFT_1913620 [Russula emetica]
MSPTPFTKTPHTYTPPQQASVKPPVTHRTLFGVTASLSNTGSQQADPLNGPVDVIATLDLLYFFTGIEQPTQGGPIILKQGPPPPKVCKLCSEKYGFDKSMLPGVARYIYGPTTANTNLRRHLYQAHAEEYDKAVLEYKWTYKLSSEVGNASTHAARASRSCR